MRSPRRFAVNARLDFDLAVDLKTPVSLPSAWFGSWLLFYRRNSFEAKELKDVDTY